MGRLILCLSVLVVLVKAQGELDEALEQIADGITTVTAQQVEELSNRLSSIIRIYGQMLSWHQQVGMERTRMEGDSGIMNVRNVFAGTRPWATNTWSRINGQAAIHNHANNIRTVGMGDVTVVLNGITFRTRHNDYRLNQAHRTSTEFGATEPVDFPPIPPSVLEKPTIEEQIEEMKEYFVAFKTQNPAHRDYKPYFKPLLTYMTGFWSVNVDTVDEPFFSDRHAIEADTYFQLQQDIMYNAWSGRKDDGENLAVLPSMIYGVNDDGSPKIAQFNYKILTHPLETEVPLNRYRPVDDLAQMMRSFKNLDDLVKTRSARFQLHHQPSSRPYDGVFRAEGDTGFENFLEEIMNEVPGLDNYPADILDSNFGDPALRNVTGDAVLRAGYYHRYYSLPRNDASGFSKAARGFADANLFVALNNQSSIFPIPVRRCQRRNDCSYEQVKASYAIPLEILYLTPLNSWNPYNISINLQNPWAPIAGGRKGRRNETADALNGASERYYYLTPAEMYEVGERDRDSADTTRDSVYILDSSGEVRRTVASGMRIFLPNIGDIGSIRTRYPIFSVHQEGSAVFKELSALKDLVRRGATYSHLYENPLGGLNPAGHSGNEVFTFALQRGDGPAGPHVHTFQLTANEINEMKNNTGSSGHLVSKETSVMAQHSHSLLLKMRTDKSGVWIHKCDLIYGTCSDSHPRAVDCIDCSSGLLEPL